MVVFFLKVPVTRLFLVLVITTVCMLYLPVLRVLNYQRQTFLLGKRLDKDTLLPAKHGDVCLEFSNKSTIYDLMFQYAAALGIARARGASLLIKEDLPLLRIFANLSATALSTTDFKTQCDTAIELKSRLNDKYSNVAKMHQDRTVKITGLLPSFRFFENIDIRNEFTFNFDIDIDCGSYLSLMRTGEDISRQRRVTVVGIHVAAYNGHGDSFHKGTERVKYAYLVKAVNYFLQQGFPAVTFVLHGNTINAIRSVLSNDDRQHVIAVNQGIKEELCIISKCDHVIVTPGSYSWWSGYLNNGIVVYNRNTTAVSSLPGNDIDDLFPPYWMGL